MEIKRVTIPGQELITKVANIHLKVLDESFLNNFGLNFLKIIYTNLLKSPDTIFLIATENNQPIGFALAIIDYSKFMTTALEQNRLALFLEISWALLKNPITAIKLLISLPNLLSSSNHPHAELQFIAIIPSYQGRGVGTQLLSYLAKEFFLYDIKKYFVGTKAENTLSNQFYRKLGFKFSYSKKYFGDQLNYYVSPEL